MIPHSGVLRQLNADTFVKMFAAITIHKSTLIPTNRFVQIGADLWIYNIFLNLHIYMFFAFFAAKIIP